MSEPFELALSAPRSRVLSGEALPVQVLVRNKSGSPASIEVGPPSPIEFELRSPAAGRRLLTRSRRIAFAEAMADRAKDPPPKREETLAADGERPFDDDVAAGSAIPIPVGSYDVVARCSIAGESYVSNALPIVVE